jgi:hypothetical protein
MTCPLPACHSEVRKSGVARLIESEPMQRPVFERSTIGVLAGAGRSTRAPTVNLSRCVFLNRIGRKADVRRRTDQEARGNRAQRANSRSSLRRCCSGQTQRPQSPDGSCSCFSASNRPSKRIGAASQADPKIGNSACECRQQERAHPVGMLTRALASIPSSSCPNRCHEVFAPAPQ